MTNISNEERQRRRKLEQQSHRARSQQLRGQSASLASQAEVLEAKLAETASKEDEREPGG